MKSAYNIEKVKHGWQSFKRFITSKDALTFLTFVLLAAGIWYTHAMVTLRTATRNVTVRYSGVPNNIAFSIPPAEALSVKMRDTGRRLISIDNDSLFITIDLSKQIQSKEGNIAVTTDLLRQNIQGQLPRTTDILRITPSEIHTTYYKVDKRIVPIQLTENLSPKSGYQLAQEPQPSHDKTTIYGERQIIDTIHYIPTEPISITEAKDTVKVLARLCLPKGVTSDIDHIEVTFIYEPFTEKIFTLPIQVKHAPEGAHLHLFPNKANVIVKTGLSHFADISEQDISLYCDYPQTLDAQTLPLYVSYQNKYITNVRINPSIVEFIIEEE